MSVQTNINEEFFPVAVAQPNQITTYYESQVLIPNLGPLLYSKLYKKLEKTIVDFNNTIKLMDNIAIFKERYKKVPTTPFIPKNIGALKELNITRAFDKKAILKPRRTLRTLNKIPAREMSKIKVNSNEMKEYKNILLNFSLENSLMSTLVDKGLLLQDKVMISDALIDSNYDKRVTNLIGTIVDKNKVKSTKEGLELTALFLKNKRYEKIHKFKENISLIISDKIFRFFERYKIQNPKDHIRVVNSCEWAFLRKEKITIDLQRPQFRGPLVARSVAPESELKISQSQSYTKTTQQSNFSEDYDNLKGYNSISSEIKNKMGVLFDYGSNLGESMSEQSYSQDNMKSEKKSRVESALREISSQNSTLTVSSNSSSSSWIREYTTQGKDKKFATTELEFEVFSPVKVKHYLEDVGAVWAPRVNNPFRGLKRILQEYYTEVYEEYILENFVINPAEPIESFELLNKVTKKTTKVGHNSDTKRDTVIFSLTQSEKDNGYYFGEDIKLKFLQESGWNVNSYEEDDYSMKTTSIRRVGDEYVEVDVYWSTDNVWGDDPDWHRLEVSIDKYKMNDAYREALKEYKHTVNKINPARKKAVQAQARKYARLKREELVRKYENNSKDLKNYAFIDLMKNMFRNGMGDSDWSYYRGVIDRCIDWKRSRFDLEPCDINELYEKNLSPYHFLNVKGLRFFLVINTGTEKIFFDTMKNVVNSQWKELFTTVERYINDQRDAFNTLGNKAREIDSYDSELILGRHLEAVLSNHEFTIE